MLDISKCGSCSFCLQNCPAEVFPEHRKKELPSCQLICPLGQDIPSYFILIAQGKFKEAMKLIQATHPLPAVCSRVCYHPCEEGCVRVAFDGALSISNLERLLGDMWLEKRG